MTIKPVKSHARKELEHAQKSLKKSIQKNRGRENGHLARKAGNARKAFLREELPAVQVVEEETGDFWKAKLEVSYD
jgi:hypothetical protein